MTTKTNEHGGELDGDAALTAYVLGELSEDEAARIERRLESDPNLRREVEAIRHAAEALRAELEAELKADTAPGLTAAQREAIAAGGGTSGAARRAGGREERRGVLFSFVRGRGLWAGVTLAAAACLVVAVWLQVENRAPEEEQLAIRMEASKAPEGAPARLVDEASRARRAGADEMIEPALTTSPAAVPTEPEVAAAGKALRDAFFKEQAEASPGASVAAPADRRSPPGARGGNEVGAALAEKQSAATDSPAPASGEYYARTKVAEVPQPATSSPPPPPPMPAAGAAPASPESQSADRFAGGGGGLGGGGGGMALRGDFQRQATVRADLDADAAEPTVQARRRGFADDEKVDQSGAPTARRIAVGVERSNREAYAHLEDNPFRNPSSPEEALSTLSIDVDTASYSNVRRIITGGRLPPPDAVRIEEMINYFDYAYEPPSGDAPFSVSVDVNECPWNAAHRLVRIGLKGREVHPDMRPATSLVFLVDVSGSMNEPDKLPLLKQSMKLLVENLTADDRVAIVVYAGAAGLVLPPTYCHERGTILDAIDHLQAGGSTNGGAGIQLAYKVAAESFIEGGVNRVILCTDGDFNVGVSGVGDLVRMAGEKRKTGVFLSVLGFGRGNWQDDRMEQISNAGNGNFAYIDTLAEARRELVDKMSGTLVTIAKDVKLQIEFNPARVEAYRLIGYANRILAARDFTDDAKDAGEIGAGHRVTVLYEVAPAGVQVATGSVDKLRYQQTRKDLEPVEDKAIRGEMLNVKVRYKEPDAETSTQLEIDHPVVDAGATLQSASPDFQFAAAVAAFGMLLRDSEYKGDASWPMVLDLASAGAPGKDDPYREEFVEMVQKARRIAEGKVDEGGGE